MTAAAFSALCASVLLPPFPYRLRSSRAFCSSCSPYCSSFVNVLDRDRGAPPPLTLSASASFLSSVLLVDGATGRSRGFAFVTMETAEDAARAVREVTGLEIDGRTIRVEVSTGTSRRDGPAVPREDRGRDRDFDRRDNRDYGRDRGDNRGRDNGRDFGRDRDDGYRRDRYGTTCLDDV